MLCDVCEQCTRRHLELFRRAKQAAVRPKQGPPSFLEAVFSKQQEREAEEAAATAAAVAAKKVPPRRVASAGPAPVPRGSLEIEVRQGSELVSRAVGGAALVASSLIGHPQPDTHARVVTGPWGLRVHDDIRGDQPASQGQEEEEEESFDSGHEVQGAGPSLPPRIQGWELQSGALYEDFYEGSHSSGRPSLAHGPVGRRAQHLQSLPPQQALLLAPGGRAAGHFFVESGMLQDFDLGETLWGLTGRGAPTDTALASDQLAD